MEKYKLTLFLIQHRIYIIYLHWSITVFQTSLRIAVVMFSNVDIAQKNVKELDMTSQEVHVPNLDSQHSKKLDSNVNTTNLISFNSHKVIAP